MEIVIVYKEQTTHRSQTKNANLKNPGSLTRSLSSGPLQTRQSLSEDLFLSNLWVGCSDPLFINNLE